MDELTALGREQREYVKLDLVKGPSNLTQVTLESDEVTALCPVTGQPDFYKVTVEYEVSNVIVESKTFKLFLQSFRTRGIFCEELADVIGQAIFDAAEPVACRVTVQQKPRGGVAIKAVAEFS